MPAGIDHDLLQDFCSAHRTRLESRDPRAKPAFAPDGALFYNPMEQLVLEQFSAEPPFGGSNIINAPLFNTPYLQQDGTVKSRILSMALSILLADRTVDWSVSGRSCFTGNFSRTCVPNIRRSTT